MRTRMLCPLLLLAALTFTGCASNKPPPTPEEIMALPDARLRSIILTDVELLNVPVDEAIRYLNEAALEADPEKIGVKIVLRNFDLHEIPWRVTVRFSQATVMQVLDETCRQSRCNYLVGKDEITVLTEDFLKRATTRPYGRP